MHIFKKLSPFQIIILWWTSWLILACINEDLNIGNTTILIVVIFLIGLSTGYLLSPQFKNKSILIKPLSINFMHGIIAMQLLIIFTLYIIFSLDFSEVRGLYYGISDQSLFQKIVLYGYGGIITPFFIYLAISYSVNGTFDRINKLYLVITALDLFIVAGRFGIYYYLFFLIYNAKSTGWNVLKITLSILIFFLGSIFLFSMRYGLNPEIEDLFVYAGESIFNYHIAPFQILSDSINSPYQYEGVLIIGLFGDLLTRFISFFGGNTILPYAGFGSYLNDINVTIGNAYYNAFGTNLLPIFFDSGYSGLFIYFFLIGIFLKKWKHNESGLIIFFSLFFGIFQPIITSTLFFIPMIISHLRKALITTKLSHQN